MLVWALMDSSAALMKDGWVGRPWVRPGSAGTLLVMSSNASLDGPHEKPMNAARPSFFAPALLDRLRRAKAGVLRCELIIDRLGVVTSAVEDWKRAEKANGRELFESEDEPEVLSPS